MDITIGTWLDFHLATQCLVAGCTSAALIVGALCFTQCWDTYWRNKD